MLTRDFSRCPRCGALTVPSIAYNGGESLFWKECSRCNTYINTYIPQPHQQSVHEDSHTFVGNFGGYGTGKTFTSKEEVYKHAFITPNANILICANIANQYEQTIKRDIESDIPKAFVKSYNAQKSYMDLINGSRIIYRPLYDPDVLRSLNLSMFVIIEASETNPESFTQLKTRARNLAASVPKRDANGEIVYDTLDNGVKVPLVDTEWIKGIIESNPDSGWIRQEVLYASETITVHGTVIDEVEVPDNVKDKAISSHIASTDVNKFLPPNYIDNQCKNKPLWWINRFIFGSFSFAESLVYPGASAPGVVVPAFQIPETWKHIVAADYGLSDDFVYLDSAVDERNGIVYITAEHRTNNKNIEELANIFHKDIDANIPVGGYYCSPILDPKSGAKRDYNKKSLFDHFLDYGINFQPGYISVDARVFRTNTYIESGRLKIFDTCRGLIEELENYKFPPKKLTTTNKSADKPMDKNNHGINPMEWICMALPKDPSQLMYGSYDKFGNDLSEDSSVRKRGVPIQLMDTEPENTGFTFDWNNN